METSLDKSIIIFDGECNLCNGVVGWLMQFAPEDIFQFIPFQSPRGQELLKKHGYPTKRLDTVILIDEKGLHTHSDGFLKIVSKIPRWKRVAALLAFVPRMLRDGIYKLASRNRVKWFGQSQSCTINFR
ncbi:thiol-disulfide oxidoreductase DCC family protein [Aquimarina sp. 2201CG14-23]|uniref:thiol-disulfide oxidoreductase DCC family protein n=1 Tax=Aquimarina mycalae TaxID=3040073 RepID=UPI002477EDB3|nr:DCC1-like thiol-disulfide oxidoreductase family protein [Aquimarina sp. 2201CG14-23]MDH7447390.1 DCC1-like thiol-disulfide oxidoreductase family protein [Aquimarina sp. 2201CG14-23]